MMKQENVDFVPNPKTDSGFLMTPTRLGSRGISKAAPSVASGGKERVKEKARKEDPEEASDQERTEKGEVTTPIRLRPGVTRLGTTKRGIQAQPTGQQGHGIPQPGCGLITPIKIPQPGRLAIGRTTQPAGAIQLGLERMEKEKQGQERQRQEGQGKEGKLSR